MISWKTIKDLPTYLRPLSDGTQSPEAARAWERRRRALLTALSSAFYRSFALSFPILTIGLFLRGLGIEIYGLWMTVTSFFAMFAFADLGLGSGLLTRLSQASGQDDQEISKKLVASTFYMLLGIAGSLLLLAVIVFPMVPWGRLLNAASAEGARATPWIIWSVVAAQILQIPFASVYRTQLALQEGYKSNLWQTAGVALNLSAVLTLVHVGAPALVLITVTSLVPMLVMILNWIYFFGFQNPWLRPSFRHFDLGVAGSMLNTGSAFFLLSILMTLGLSLDNFLVSRVCGVNQVAAFSVATRMATVLSMIVDMLSMPMWSAYGEALARGDKAWVRHSCLRLAGLSFLLALTGGFFLVTLGPWIFAKWLGKELVIGRSLLFYCSLRSIMLACASPFFMVLNGAGIVRPQVYAFLVFTPLAIGLKVVLAKFMGSSGVALGMALLYGSFILPWVIRRALGTCRTAM